jgi:hypothetical protein
LKRRDCCGGGRPEQPIHTTTDGDSSIDQCLLKHPHEVSALTATRKARSGTQAEQVGSRGIDLARRSQTTSLLKELHSSESCRTEVAVSPTANCDALSDESPLNGGDLGISIADAHGDSGAGTSRGIRIIREGHAA